MQDTKTIFETLSKIDVSDKVEKKNGLSYLSWAWAWQKFMEVCPDAKYEIKMFQDKPYLYDEKLGYMVFTSITVGEDTKEMWLPVMDSRNKAMKDHPYKYPGYNGKENVCDAASMFDINKTIMRCLVKNIAMFGLGLYIYAGEDMPEQEAEQESKATANQIAKIHEIYSAEAITKMLKYYHLQNLESMSATLASNIIRGGLMQNE